MAGRRVVQKGSLTLYLWAKYGGIRLERPSHVAVSLREAMDGILPLLDIRQDGDHQDQACHIVTLYSP